MTCYQIKIMIGLNPAVTLKKKTVIYRSYNLRCGQVKF